MQLEELKERYNLVPLWARVVAWTLIGAGIAAYLNFGEAEELDGQLVAAKNDLEAARSAFEKASKDKGDLPKLEEQRAFTEEQLTKAKKKLPDSYRIEEILQKAATIAKEVGVKFVSFKPGEEVPKNAGVKYMELPIATEIEGRFNQLAAFMDRVVHLEMNVFIRNVDFAVAAVGDQRGGAMQQDEERSEYEKQRLQRQNLRVAGRFDLVIFRAMTDQEAATHELPDGGANPPGGAPAAGAPPAGGAAPPPAHAEG